MKVLYITNPMGPDYLGDSIFHGGKTILGTEFYELKRMWYMYDDLVGKEKLYGRGFTMFGKLSSTLYNPLNEDVTELIKNKFFDKIIYGSVWRSLDHLDLVLNTYSKKDVIFIDGEDHDNIRVDLINNGSYFKREYYSKMVGVHPISFSIPEELVLSKVTEKTKLISDIIPCFNWNYTFNSEQDYYDEYSSSWYGTTMKKAGWDCLRHYEIMMNGCVPLFKGLEDCPELTLTTLPKKELIKMSQSNESNIEYNEFILEYTKNNLTTKHTIEKILN